MSHHSSSSSATQPLSDILPWGNPITVVHHRSSSDHRHRDDCGSTSSHGDHRRGPNPAEEAAVEVVAADCRTLLVTDACPSDGRFLLHALTLQFLSSRHPPPFPFPPPPPPSSSLRPPRTTTATVVVAIPPTTSSASAAAPSADVEDDDAHAVPPTPPRMLEGAVLWIACTSVIERQIVTGLRKASQHDLGGVVASASSSSYLGGGTTTPTTTTATTTTTTTTTTSAGGGWGAVGGGGRIRVISVPLELADAALEGGEGGECCAFSHEMYLRGLHGRIVNWLDDRRESVATTTQEAPPSSPPPPEEGRRRRRRRTRPRRNNRETTMGPNLIIIDSATSLATMFGDKLTSMFISSIRSSMRKRSSSGGGRCPSSMSSSSWDSDAGRATSGSAVAGGRGGPTDHAVVTTVVDLLAVRVSSPDDGGLYRVVGDGDGGGTNAEGGPRSEYARLLWPWLGYGSGGASGRPDEDGGAGTTSIPLLEEQSNYLSLSSDSVPSLLYRSGLLEIVDGIVDVSPLESGYARDVLGRLSFVATWGGKGWWGIADNAVGLARTMGGGDIIGSGGHATKKKEGIFGAYSSICVNYRCDDSGVRVMRLRSR